MAESAAKFGSCLARTAIDIPRRKPGLHHGSRTLNGRACGPAIAIRDGRGAEANRPAFGYFPNATLHLMPAGILLSGFGNCSRTPKVPLAASMSLSTTTTLA